MQVEVILFPDNTNTLIYSEVRKEAKKGGDTISPLVERNRSANIGLRSPSDRAASLGFGQWNYISLAATRTRVGRARQPNDGS